MTGLLKLFLGFLKFYFVLMGFGMLANAITYASADLLLFVESGCTQSYWIKLLNSTDATGDGIAWEALRYFWQTAFHSVPFDSYFDTTLGVAFDGSNGNILTFVIGLFGEDGQVLKPSSSFSQQTSAILKDVAITALSSFVLFGVTDFKKKLSTFTGIAGKLGFAFAFPYWIFAGYTFANCLIASLELVFDADQSNVLYLSLTVLGMLLTIFIQWLSPRSCLKKGFALRTIAYWIFKLVLCVIEAFLAWLLCRSIANFLTWNVLPALTIISALLIFTSMLEQYISEWTENGLFPIKIK
ncbi:MAG: hypothetical protein IJ012_00915 [Clostridia bacterium]|nr:hypothetical protein [Clostridia bacterium]